MKLFYTRPSPYARKARAAALELGLEDRVELVEVTTLTHPTNNIPELLRENPLQKVPVLIAEDRQRLFDSVVIAEYLDALAGGTLFPKDGRRWPSLKLHALAQGIMDAGVAVRLESLRPEDKRWDNWMEAHLRKVTNGLDAVDAEPDLLDGPFNVGHLALACAIEWLAFRTVYSESEEGRPRLAAWFADVRERPSLIATRPV
nr:glutathione S-transferase family protein [uncultured Sphingosinicella sp.]